MLKKSLIILFLFIVFLSLFLIFPQKVTKEKVENKVTQTIKKVEEIKETIVPKPTKILETGLPDQHQITAPFVQQAPEKNWDEPWQDACEEASLLTVDYFYQNKKSISVPENRDAILKMIEFENSQNFTSDMNIDQMVIVGQKYLGYQTKIIDNPTIQNIKEYLAKDIPIIVPASGKILFKENTHFNSGGPYYHNIVILGYNDDKQQFTVHDVGTKAGSYFHYSYSLLMESIHDFPNSGKKEDINNGQKKILVLLK